MKSNLSDNAVELVDLKTGKVYRLPILGLLFAATVFGLGITVLSYSQPIGSQVEIHETN